MRRDYVFSMKLNLLLFVSSGYRDFGDLSLRQFLFLLYQHRMFSHF